jgi:DNA topoisomerase-3
VREPPPLLFDLTSLQRTANRRFGLSAARTLEIAQALYERHKVVTYPRTDSRHLSSDVANELAGVFEMLADVPDFAAFASALVAAPPRPGRRVVDDAKVSDHHAIIPTAKAPRLDALDRDERRVYDLIVRRFLGAFFPDAEFAVTEVWIRVGPGAAAPPAKDEAPSASDDRVRTQPTAGEEILQALPPLPDRYFARGRVRLVTGWQDVAGIDPMRRRRGDGDRDGDDDAAVLPPLAPGQPLDGAFAAIAKQTTPPPRYTEATLLGAMESAGKAMDDEALRLAMKDRGLGTPATRASIIETLLQRGYIARTGGSLVPTPLGDALITSLPIASLASAELTGTWEARLARIARGEETRDAFMADIARYVTEIVDAIRAAEPPAAPPGVAAPAFGGKRGWKRGGKRRWGSKSRNGANGSSRGTYERTGARRRATTSNDGERAPTGRRDEPDASSSMTSRRDAGAPKSSMASRRDTGAPKSSMASRRDTGAPKSSMASRGGSSSSTSDSRAPSSRSSTIFRRDTGGSSSSTLQRMGTPVELSCPRCGAGTLITGSRGWGCSRWRDGCRFVVWFQFAGRRITAAQLRDLVTRGKTRKARFVSEHGDVNGRLVLDPAADDSVRLERS